MKVALGLITKYINADISILDFLKNANKFGHEIDALIICYSHGYDRPFVEKLERLYPSIEYVNRLMTHSWGQRVIRFYDLDGNLIEVGTPM